MIEPLSILELAPDGFVVLGDRFECIYINVAGAKLLQRERDALIGAVLCDVFPGLDQHDAGIALKQALLGHTSASFETFYEPLASWLSVRAYPSRLGLVVYFADVTERHVAAAALSEREDRLRRVLDATQSGVFDLDFVSNTTYLSPRFDEIFGFKPDEITHAVEAFRPYIHPDDLQRVIDASAQAAANRVPFVVEFRITRKDGELRWVRQRAAIEVGPDGAATRVWGTIADVTDQRAAEDALRESRRFLSSANTLARLSAFTASRDSARLWWSPEAFDLLGLDASTFALNRESVATLIHPDDLARMGVVYRRTFDTGTPLDTDGRFRHANGEWRHFHLRAELVNDHEVPYVFGTMQDVTDRVRAESARIESERQLKVAQRIARVGSWSWDIVTGAVDWSEEMFRIQGFDPTSTTPSFDAVLATAIDDAHREEFMSRVQRALAGEDRYDFVMPMRRPTGERRVLHTRGEVQRDVQGLPIRMTGTAEDITDRRDAEEALRRSERELDRAQRMARVGSFTRSLTTGDAWWSSTTREILEMEGSPPDLEVALSRLAPGDSERYRELLRRAIDDGEPFDFETRAILPSGRVVDLQLIGEVDLDANARPVSVHGLLIDITAERERERALRESEERFRTLADAAPIGIFLARDGVLTYMNPRMRELFAFDDGKIQGRWIDRIHPEDRDRVAVLARESLVGRTPFRSEHRLRLPDATIRHVRVTTAPIATGEASYSGQVGAVEDITAEVHAADERDRLEAQVRSSQKLESLGVLAGGIAHDFNNLLVGVLTNASMALMDLPPGATARDAVQDIERAAQRAAELTRQLLAYSGKGRFVIEPLSISLVAGEMAQLLRTVVSKRASLALELDENVPNMKGDATQLRQVIMNLITNASDALGDANGTLTVRTRVATLSSQPKADALYGSLEVPGRYLVLEVADTGVGMDEDTLQRIFDPFFTTKFTGRGLGLAATLGIVRGHGGAIAVHSAIGKGTTFALYFPPSSAPLHRTTPAVGTAIVDGHGMVLVVDDDESVRTVTTSLLKRRGYTVRTAVNGADGVACFRESPQAFRAVLLDLTMPELGGGEALAQMRDIDASVPVVLMSGYSDAEIERNFADAGLAGFLQKPFRADDLYSVLARALAPT